MVTLVVYLVIILGLTVTVGWSVLSYQRSAEIVTLAQRNAARMDQIASLVRANLRTVEFGGRMRAPLGERSSSPIQPAGAYSEAQGKFVASSPSEQVCADEREAVMAGSAPSPAFAQACYRMTLPKWVVADTKTPWGADYGYCPYSVDPVSGTAPAHVQTTDAVIRPGEGQAYPARTVRNRGRDFVLQSANQQVQVIDGNLVTNSSVAEQGIVGFVVSPPPNVRGSAPLCSQITLRDGSWIVQGPNGTSPTVSGSVVPVFLQGVGAGSANVQDDVTLFAAAAKATPEARGTGDSPADPIPFKDLLDLWHYMPWQSATFVVAPGTYSFDATDMVPGSAVPRLSLKSDKPGRSLRITSSTPAQVVLATTGTADLTIGVDARLENVSLAPGVRLRAVDGARVQVSGGTFGIIRVDGGDLDLWGASVSHDPAFGTSSAIDLTSGRLKLGGGTFQIANVPAGGIALNVLGGELVLDGTDVAIGAGAGALSIATQTIGRVASVPKPDGSPPVVQITGPGGTLSSPIANESYAAQECLGGADGTFTCAAYCPTEVPRLASAGSCHAEPADGDHPIPPSLVRSSRHNLLTKAPTDANAWSCTWRSGFSATPGSIPNTVNLEYSTMPKTRVEARCLPNATLVAPAAGPPA